MKIKVHNSLFQEQKIEGSYWEKELNFNGAFLILAKKHGFEMFMKDTSFQYHYHKQFIDYSGIEYCNYFHLRMIIADGPEA